MKHTLPCVLTNCMNQCSSSKPMMSHCRHMKLQSTEHSISGVGFIVWKRYLILDMYTSKITAHEIHMKIFTESRPAVKVKFPCNFQCHEEFHLKSCLHKNFTHIFKKKWNSHEKPHEFHVSFHVVILPV